MMPPISSIQCQNFSISANFIYRCFYNKTFLFVKSFFIKFFRNICRNFTTGSGGYLACLLYIFNNRIMVGSKWKNRSNMSIGWISVPFLSIINFSRTCGMGLNGARSNKIATKIRAEKGILSRKVRIVYICNNDLCYGSVSYC